MVCLDSLMIILGHHYVAIIMLQLIWARNRCVLFISVLTPDNSSIFVISEEFYMWYYNMTLNRPLFGRKLGSQSK